MKRLVVCCDGTWNTAGQDAPTNVFRTSESVAPIDAGGVEQLVHYQQGVGTKLFERLSGGIFGYGLSGNVKEAYGFVVEHHEPGDEIYLLGFSRGAYTARSTAGLIRNSGVLRREHAGRMDEAYALYRDRAKPPRSAEAEQFRAAYAKDVTIRLVGVWDTVGALGIPLSGSRLVGRVNRRWSFHDTALSSTVQHAYQAVAVDERRAAFRPTLWSQQAHAVDQVLEQVWFAGVHSDVGGGYAERQLADVALAWMLERARACGLAVTPPAVDAHAALGPVHDSRRGVFGLFPAYDRPIGTAADGHECVASTTVARWRDPVSSYRPGTLQDYLSRPDARVTPVEPTG